MIERSAIPATFTIERHYPAKPARVFAAWASVEAKARWAYCDEAWKPQLHELDFRVGGRERDGRARDRVPVAGRGASRRDERRGHTSPEWRSA